MEPDHRRGAGKKKSKREERKRGEKAGRGCVEWDKRVSVSWRKWHKDKVSVHKITQDDLVQPTLVLLAGRICITSLLTVQYVDRA